MERLGGRRFKAQGRVVQESMGALSLFSFSLLSLPVWPLNTKSLPLLSKNSFWKRMQILFIVTLTTGKWTSIIIIPDVGKEIETTTWIIKDVFNPKSAKFTLKRTGDSMLRPEICMVLFMGLCFHNKQWLPRIYQRKTMSFKTQI